MKDCRKSGTIDRKTIEKNRRIQMKALCFKLVSLITPRRTINHEQKQSSNKEQDICTQTDQLDNAADYIQELRKRIDDLKRKKWDMINGVERDSRCSSTCTITDWNLSGANLPILEVRDFETSMIVVIVTGLNKNLMLYQLITILEEQGAEVVNASFATVNDKIFHTIHSRVTCRVGVETAKICDRLKKLVYA